MEWTLANIVRTHAAHRGGQPMLTYGTRTITYAAMDATSNRVAQALLAEGIGRQDRVAFLDKNGPEYFEVLFGGAKVNAVNVAVNWRLAPEEMERTINDAQAKLLFVGADFLPHVEGIETKLETVDKIIVLGDSPRHETYRTWMERAEPIDPGHSTEREDVAMQLYTSGTTGLPKGAMLSNSNLGAILPHVSGPWGLDATSVNLIAMPLFHIGGSGWALCGMWNGCHSILLREFVPPDVLADHPAEVENALSGHPAIADVAVIGVPHERWGETGKAIVVKRAGMDPQPEEIIDYARRHLAHYKCPTSVDFAEALPRNPSGKLLKRQLREPYWKGHARRIN